MRVVFILLLVFVVPIVVGQLIGKPKHRHGWAWGLLLGWLGVIIVACLGPLETASERELAELEAEVRLAELQQRRAALSR